MKVVSLREALCLQHRAEIDVLVHPHLVWCRLVLCEEEDGDKGLDHQMKTSLILHGTAKRVGGCLQVCAHI